MADNSVLVFKCLNPDCGKPVKLALPARSGVYPVTCPHCKTQKKLNIKGLDAFQEAETPAEKVPDNSAKPPVTLTEDFIVGEEYRFMCPHCSVQELGLRSQKAGHKDFACPRCKGRIGADVRPKTVVLDLDTDTSELVRGRLVLLRRGWLNKNYPLGPGRHVVGRYDENEMPDIAVKNDSTVSRRSVRIDVTHESNGFIFKLTVLNATNPVLHNSNPLAKGEAVSLNFGDTIVLGKTKFRFEKDA